MDINVEVYHTKLKPELANLVHSAIEAKEWFGLSGKRSIVVFCPVDLKSYFIHQTKGLCGTVLYKDFKSFTVEISLYLLTHKQFVSREKLLGMMNGKLLNIAL